MMRPTKAFGVKLLKFYKFQFYLFPKNKEIKKYAKLKVPKLIIIMSQTHHTSYNSS